MNFNLLDLNNDILNIIGYYVKKDNLERKLEKDIQIINGKEIRFHLRHYWSIYGLSIRKPISKDIIKRYIFDNVDYDIKLIKVYAQIDKIKLTRPDLRMCFWVCFQRYFVILNDYNLKIKLNIEDKNNYFDEYLTLKKLNLKKKNYSFNY